MTNMASSSGDTIADDDSPMTNGLDTPPSEDSTNQTNGHAFQLASSSSFAIERLTRESTKLIDTVNEIALLGLENSSRQLDLPRIVTIGDQSAGKSSAIAAISGITVPRKAGICTRVRPRHFLLSLRNTNILQCPSHINLKKSNPGEPWSCTISIVKDHAWPKNKWIKQDAEVIELARVNNSDDLQAALERAQLAVLNPGSNPQLLMHCRTEDLPPKNQTGLSPNRVRLDIRGPSCPNLTFFDLPGIFNQTGREEDRHLVGEVHKLVQGYIESENNILLVACAIGTDMDISSTGSLIRDSESLKAQNHQRCIGLLTKADLLPPGTPIEGLEAILENRDFRLGHGYYVTKQPNQLELNQGVTHEQARAIEDRFFRENTPWSTDLVRFSKQFGIPQLQTKLSDLLVKHIRDR